MEAIHANKTVLRKFGITMGLVFVVISCVLAQHCRYGSAISGFVISLIFFTAGIFAPSPLRYLYIAWMYFAFALAWINTKIILIFIFYIIFVPLGLFMKLLKIDLLERKNKENTYWKQKDENFKLFNYERRF